MNATYAIFVNSAQIATVDGVEFAYEAWAKARDLAEMIGAPATLVAVEDSEIVAEYDPEEIDDEPDDIDSGCGFDPYEGCYTWDC